MNTNRSSICAATLLLPFLVAACDSRSGDGSIPSPALTILDSVQLQDPSAVPLGTPGDFVRLSNGAYLVADPQNTRILEFDSHGNQSRSIGRKGGGPGEFKSLASLAMDADSVLYALEPSVLNVVDYRTGEFREKVKLPAPFVFSIAAKNSNVYFRGVDSARSPILSVWRNSLVLAGPTLPAPSTLPAVKAANAAENAAMLNPTNSMAVFTPLNGDTVAVLSQASESILLVTPRQLVSEIPVARTQRQGIREDIIVRIATDPSVVERDPQLLYASSTPTAVARGLAGSFYTVKNDLTFLGKRFAAKLFLSVTDPYNGRTCPDARIPGPEDPRPTVTFRGDTLFVLSQEIQGTAAATIIRKYLIGTDGCKWLEGERTN